MSANDTNPFAQPATMWRVCYRVPMEYAVAVEEALEEGALATMSFEDPAAPEAWTVEVLCADQPDIDLLASRLEMIVEHTGIVIPKPVVESVIKEDWQANLERDFPPLHIGRFYVHGAHAKTGKPSGAKAIQVEAGMAFGSGEHATTSQCLRAIEILHCSGMHCERILDMGCGSGILAVAAAHCWPKAQITAVDIDPVSVRIARENFALNHQQHIRAYAGNGYALAEVKKRGSYDLILSNILARPLVKFSTALEHVLSPGGIAVLSGLLASQEKMVLEAHRRQRLKLVKRLPQDGWNSLLLQKGML